MGQNPTILHHDINRGPQVNGGERFQRSLGRTSGRPRHRNQDQSKQCTDPCIHEKTTPTSSMRPPPHLQKHRFAPPRHKAGLNHKSKARGGVLFVSSSDPTAQLRQELPHRHGKTNQINIRTNFFKNDSGACSVPRPQVVRRRSIQVLRPHRAGKTVLARSMACAKVWPSSRWPARRVLQHLQPPPML